MERYHHQRERLHLWQVLQLQGRLHLWTASAARLTQLKMYLYENTETATRIDQLGWQSAGFYAFGNGVLANGTWYPVDEYGIVRLPELGNQRLAIRPSCSSTYPLRTLLSATRLFLSCSKL